MKKQMTLIYYYVPQDKDDPEVPNVFGINIKKDDIRLKHLQQNFPITGEYIFRFKVLYENSIAWLDLPDLNAKLPTFKDKIMVKASRVSWQSKRAQEKPQHQNKIINSTGQQQHTSHSNSTEQKFQSLDSKPETKAQKPAIRVESKKATESFNLIDDELLHHGHASQHNHGGHDSLL